MIRFDNVVKKLGGRAVLDGVTFSAPRGGVTAIVGPSGTGKSVTLKHIVGLLTPTSGTVEVDGVDVGAASGAELAAVRARTGYLFQGGALLGWLTVAENVELPLRECTRLGDGEISGRVEAALAAVELSDAADKFPAEISGGMVKRAGLARAIVRKSDIILYDEPTSGLDPVTALTINALVKRLNSRFGITSVVVTHDLQQALLFADRIVMLKGGKVAAQGTPLEFISSESRDVKDFLEAQLVAPGPEGLAAIKNSAAAARFEAERNRNT